MALTVIPGAKIALDNPYLWIGTKEGLIRLKLSDYSKTDRFKATRAM